MIRIISKENKIMMLFKEWISIFFCSLGICLQIEYFFLKEKLDKVDVSSY